jgi:DNA-binding NtrC family response regulator
MATILCIDDSENILELHRALLESNGHKVLVALDGPSGIAISHNECIDAVVIDFNMPGMNGDQVALAIMKNQPTARVVVCSGVLDEIPESLKWFADAVLPKADGPQALLSAIARVVRSGATDKRTPVRRGPRADERLCA